MLCSRLQTALWLGLLGAATAVGRAAEAPTDAGVSRAIARGVEFLRDQQAGDGHWDYQFQHVHTLGITALAGLALLENGVERTDPSIVRAERAVRRLSEPSDLTYDLALAILFLARVQPGSRGPHDALIRRLGARLAGGGPQGLWTYTVPLEPDDDDDLPARGRRRSRGRPFPRFGGGPGDHSNTQFALLGIWAAGRHGFDSNAALAAIDEHFRGIQESDGRWGYQPGSGGSPAMTCAGLMGLSIAAARPELAEQRTARARGAALAADPVFAAGLKAVAQDARRMGPHTDIYYLWSLERVSVALGLRDLEGFDWYAVGARELLDRQQPDGSWPTKQWGILPDTCLALLFLHKANLAFELDRVLKLPGPGREPARDDPEPSTPPKPGPGTPRPDDVTVTVTNADESHFPEITVDFLIRNPDGSYLLDASREDIHVREYGQEVPILRFQGPRATELRPTTVVLVVDRSLSMEDEDRIGGLKKAVRTFLQGLPRGSRVAVVAFGSDVEEICPFTEDARRVQEAVDTLVPAGATRYYDAVAEALDRIGKESGRRAVLALTDGEDTFSQTATLDSVIARAQRMGVPVHTLGLGSEDEIESTALKRLAHQTRGQYYPARRADELRSIYEELAANLKNSYSLAYRTEHKLPDGTLRPVSVSFRASQHAGQTAVFIRGMVVPAPVGAPLFLGLLAVLGLLALVPSWLARRSLG